jgi:hypothetical protein
MNKAASSVRLFPSVKIAKKRKTNNNEAGGTLYCASAQGHHA